MRNVWDTNCKLSKPLSATIGIPRNTGATKAKLSRRYYRCGMGILRPLSDARRRSATRQHPTRELRRGALQGALRLSLAHGSPMICSSGLTSSSGPGPGRPTFLEGAGAQSAQASRVLAQRRLLPSALIFDGRTLQWTTKSGAWGLR